MAAVWYCYINNNTLKYKNENDLKNYSTYRIN